MYGEAGRHAEAVAAALRGLEVLKELPSPNPYEQKRPCYERLAEAREKVRIHAQDTDDDDHSKCTLVYASTSEVVGVLVGKHNQRHVRTFCSFVCIVLHVACLIA